MEGVARGWRLEGLLGVEGVARARGVGVARVCSEGVARGWRGC